MGAAPKFVRRKRPPDQQQRVSTEALRGGDFNRQGFSNPRDTEIPPRHTWPVPVTPLDASYDVLDRAEGLLKFDGGTETVPLLQYDVRRQALSMAVAALDTWMHWSIRRVDLRTLSNRLGALEVPFSTLVDMAEHSISSRNVGIQDRPRVRARNALNEQLLTMTFQNARQWEYGFNLLGIRSGLTSAGAGMTPPESKSSVEDHLNRLSHRRNKIVHEGDLVRRIRPQTIRREVLLRSDIDEDIAWIRRFLGAVDLL